MNPFVNRRGTLREPGPDLARLPVAPDLAGINIAEGLRAAVAFASIVLLEWWLAWPPLLTMALAANLTCFCDIGGPSLPRPRAALPLSRDRGAGRGGRRATVGALDTDGVPASRRPFATPLPRSS